MSLGQRVTVAVAMFAICGAGAAATPRAEALARELFKLTRGTHGPSPLFVMSVLGSTVKPDSKEGRLFKDRELKVATEAEKNAVRIYSISLSEPHLEQLVAFFKTEPGRTFVQLGETFATIEEGVVAGIVQEGLKETADLSRLKRTMADMIALGSATEAFAAVNGSYPRQRSIVEFSDDIAPFLKSPARADGWGTEFKYYVSEDKKSYRLVSAGPDQTFDTASRRLNMQLQKGDDLVYQNGEFLQSPNFE